MKRRWPVVIGVSLFGVVASAAGLLSKKPKKEDPKNWAKKYLGHWTFKNEREKTVHQIFVDSQFRLTIDGQAINGVLLELNNTRLVWQDQFGFQLKIAVDGFSGGTIYDEADDTTYILKKLN